MIFPLSDSDPLCAISYFIPFIRITAILVNSLTLATGLIYFNSSMYKLELVVQFISSCCYFGFCCRSIHQQLTWCNVEFYECIWILAFFSHCQSIVIDIFSLWCSPFFAVWFWFWSTNSSCVHFYEYIANKLLCTTGALRGLVFFFFILRLVTF